MEKIFYQIDAFTDRKFGGNPAAVLLDAEGLDEEQMLKIAREMALSETVFVRKSKGNKYDYEVRFFTPKGEVDLCGHGTIATFFIMAEKGMISAIDKKVIMKQRTLAGILPVEIYFQGNRVEKVMMEQKSPDHLFTVKDIDNIANIMGMNKYDIGLEGFKALPMAYSTGIPDIILPVKNLDLLKKTNPDFERLEKYSKEHHVVGVHAFTIENIEKKLISCRNFAPAYGINEEAATGTSNGALAAYLIENRIIDMEESLSIICKQGYFMDRPSQIFVEVERVNRELVIKVGGRAVLIIEGKIYL